MDYGVCPICDLIQDFIRATPVSGIKMRFNHRKLTLGKVDSSPLVIYWPLVKNQ